MCYAGTRGDFYGAGAKVVSNTRTGRARRDTPALGWTDRNVRSSNDLRVRRARGRARDRFVR